MSATTPGDELAPTRSWRTELTQWVRSHPGQEVCGILAADQDARRGFVGLNNSTGIVNHCEITRREWDRVMRGLQLRGWEPLAFIHTHLGPAAPSTTDTEHSLNGDLPWVIVPVADNDVGSPVYAQCRRDAGDFSFYPLTVAEAFGAGAGLSWMTPRPAVTGRAPPSRTT